MRPGRRGLFRALLLGLLGLLLLPIAARAQNDPPALLISDSFGIPVNDGDARTIDDDTTLSLDIATSDPDGDPVTVTVTLLDGGGTPVPGHIYDPGTGTWSWTPGQSPTCDPFRLYSLDITACDDQSACTSVTISLTVNRTQLLPTTPNKQSPPDQTWVATHTPTFIVDDPINPGTAGEVEFELYYYVDPGPTPSVSPDQSATIPVSGAGQTSWVPAGIPENTLVYWRVRAHALICGVPVFSPWSGYWSFFVNALVPAPLAPVLVEPAEGALVDTLHPVLTANNSTDPEGDAIDLFFEVATDDTFMFIVAWSSAVPQETFGSFTSWTVDTPLTWDTPYAARAYAVERWSSTQSPYSNTIHFHTRTPDPPTDVILIDLHATCADTVLRAIPSYFDVSLSVADVPEPVAIALEIYDATDTPGVDPPLFATRQEQLDVGTFTRIPVDSTVLVENLRHRVRVRALEGPRTSGWVTCSFWLDAVNERPAPVAILSPGDGASFPPDTDVITVEVSGSSDPDEGIPGNSLRLGYCVTLSSASNLCAIDPVLWHQEAFDSDGSTTLPIAALIDGRPLANGQQLQLSVSAIDERDLGSHAAVREFSIETPMIACTPLACAGGDYCDVATGLCTPCGCPGGASCSTDGTCPTVDPPPDGGGDDGGGSGGCSQPGDAPPAAGLMVAAAVLLLARRRRV